jgi:hypothetical protein
MTDGDRPSDDWRATIPLLLGCLIGVPLATVMVLGPPIAIFHGVTTGDWTWLIPSGIAAITLWVLARLGVIATFND